MTSSQPPTCRPSSHHRGYSRTSGTGHGDAASSSGSGSSSHRRSNLVPSDFHNQLAPRSSGSGTSGGSSGHRRRSQHPSSSSSSRPVFYQQRIYELNSDSDPFAPPPTPRSQYMSDCYTHGETTEGDEDVDDAIAQAAAHLEENLEISRQRESHNPAENIDDIDEEEASTDENTALVSPSQDMTTSNQEVQITNCAKSNNDEDDEPTTTDDDDAETVLSAPQHRNTTRNSAGSCCIYNPPPSPVTD